MTDGSMHGQVRPPPVIARPLAVTSQPAAPPAGAHQPPSERIHYLDWLRVLALLGVFLYHAVHPFDTLEWHVKNADQSELITGVLVFFYPWGLGLFFLLAGAGAFFSLRSRAAGGYAAERARRLLVPPAGRLGPAVAAAGLHRGTPPRLVGRLVPPVHSALLR
jgi:peptidoglycan/LPS O-acetylase OafA/YrhL